MYRNRRLRGRTAGPEGEFEPVFYEFQPSCASVRRRAAAPAYTMSCTSPSRQTHKRAAAPQAGAFDYIQWGNQKFVTSFIFSRGKLIAWWARIAENFLQRSGRDDFVAKPGERAARLIFDFLQYGKSK